MGKIGRAGLALLPLSLMGSQVMVEDPVLAPGRDPGGTPIAVISDGFDYKNTELALFLARDGEGEAIALDTADGDRRPFRQNGRGTKTALSAAAFGGVRIVMVRVDWGSPFPLFKATGFTQVTPARIALIALSQDTRSHLAVLTKIAEHTKEILFVASIPAATPDERSQSEGVASFVLLDSKDNQLVAAEAVARVLGCGQPALTGANGAELKTEFLARLQQPAPAACNPKGGGKDQ
jgi:hypothetical protein